MSKKVFVRVLPVMLLALAACGRGSNGGGADDLKDAVSQALLDDSDTSDLPFEVDKAVTDCFADVVLGNTGFKDKLQAGLDKGLSGQELLDSAGDPTSDDEMMRPMFSCFSTDQYVELLSAQVEDQNLVTDDKKQCLRDEFDSMGQDMIVDGFIAFNNDDTANEGSTKITAAMISCFGLESFG